MHKELKTDNNEILNTCCGGDKSSPEEMYSAIDEVIKFTGTDSEKVILILQEVQKRLNWLPSDALKYICKITDITPGQISGVSTFYTQFRHLPVGKHTIKICAGTACHVKGSPLISDAFKRSLKIDNTRNASPDNLFSIEEVACLGCCTLAPVVQIDNKTYGHVKPTQVDEIINDFKINGQKDKTVSKTDTDTNVDAEVRIGIGSCCVAGGSKEILSEIFAVKERYNLNIRLKQVGCVGVCNQTPLMEIVTKQNEHSRYTKVTTSQVEEILLKHVRPGRFNNRIKSKINDLVDTFLSDDKLTAQLNLPVGIREKYLINFLDKQIHIATENSGVLSPESFFEYKEKGGFKALEKCLHEQDKQSIIKAIADSGLRGRGGAGFSTGRKWLISSNTPGELKYVVCNGDEGDPGAFMDRMLLESFPFRVIEGMIIAGFATGAREGVFYIRAEYPLAVTRIRIALKLCYENGILGSGICDSSFDFDINVFEGAGAFVCGEETALIASLEGKRGTPHLRPPYPAVKGYLGKPTLVNNVETLSLVPWIINNGAAAFASVGTEKSKGTKVFALAGKISKGGLIEVPMGTTIREIVENIGDGVADGNSFKAVQIGGPSGGCIPAEHLDVKMDYESLVSLGSIMGSGGLIVMDKSSDMVDVARYFMEFCMDESCGKCVPCRVGTKMMHDLLQKICDDKGTSIDLERLEELAVYVKETSLCGLGASAPNPLLSTLRHFRHEYENRIQVE